MENGDLEEEEAYSGEEYLVLNWAYQVNELSFVKVCELLPPGLHHPKTLIQGVKMAQVDVYSIWFLLSL